MPTSSKRGWPGVVIAALAAAAVVAVPSGAPAARQTVGAAPTDTIWISASVVDGGGRLVTNLTAADFEVTDNGTPRDITVFRSDRLPFALSIMIDLSSSMATNYATMRRGIMELLGGFQPGDRAIVGGFDALPWLTNRFSGNADTLALQFATVAGRTAPLCDGPWIDKTRLINQNDTSEMGAINLFNARLLRHEGTAAWDGLECAINAVASDAETPRRIALIITDGVDNASASTQADVIRDANAAGVMIYAIGMLGTDSLAAGELRGISEQTGGGYFFLQTRDDLVTAFGKIADDLRHQYVFGFSAGESLRSRHDLSVRVKRADATTHARRVYLESLPPAFRPATRPATAPALVAPLPSSLVAPASTARAADPVRPTPSNSKDARAPTWDAFDQLVAGRWTFGHAPLLSGAQLASMLTDLRRDAPAWVRAGDPSDQSRRRLGVAVFVLDLLHSQSDPLLWRDNQPASDLLEWAGNALRSGPADSGERLWYNAAFALVERAGAASTLDRLVAHAQDRFPTEERWALARGIAQELRTWPEPRDLRAFAVDPAVAVTIRARYREAAALASVRQEALIRLGFFELRNGRADAALASFNDAGAPTDPYLSYWLHLFEGRAYERLNRGDNAVAAYQRAFQDAPFAPSATSALTRVLLALHRQSEASQLAARAMTMPPADDPWMVYGVPDSRFWSALIDALRATVMS